MAIVDDLLLKKPFELAQREKQDFFLEAIRESLRHHYQNNDRFKRFVDSKRFNIDAKFSLEGVPFLPASVFKELELITGPKENIKKKVQSSSTSIGKPSNIYLDSITINRQRKALVSILSDFIGSKKKVFFVFDRRATVIAKDMDVSSRASAIRGILPFSKSMHFLLNDQLEFSIDFLEEARASLSEDDQICFFGFSWLIYKTLMNIKGDKDVLDRFSGMAKRMRNNMIVLHTGGWKRLQELSISKDTFNKEVGTLLNIPFSKVIDFYGMTEQLGTVYPDCEYGYKHAPLYSEIIIRDINSFQPCPIAKTGFIQLISPVPNSYPGISIISDDLGQIEGVDDCKCGRKGKYFVFKRRAEKAELKGCGDTLAV